jgi:hypothetical protein
LIRLSDDPYLQILDYDITEYRYCSFHWDCENGTKSLCISLVGVTDLPSLYGHFKILGFVNNLERYGVEVKKRVPLEVPSQEHDERHMRTKKDRFEDRLRL